MEPIQSQLSSRLKYPELVLGEGSLYDLEPGKLFAFKVGTFELFPESFVNNRDLWLTLNPGESSIVNSLDSVDSHNYISNRVSQYVNISRPKETELGNYYFARHPDHLPLLFSVFGLTMAWLLYMLITVQYQHMIVLLYVLI